VNGNSLADVRWHGCKAIPDNAGIFAYDFHSPDGKCNLCGEDIEKEHLTRIAEGLRYRKAELEEELARIPRWVQRFFRWWRK
jgi:hypothetical protein